MNTDIILNTFEDDISDIEFVSEALTDNVGLMNQFSNFVSNALRSVSKEYDKLIPEYNKMTNDIIAKHKSTLINFDGSVDIKGYTYSFNSSVPNLNAQKPINNMYITLITNSGDMTQAELADIKNEKTSPRETDLLIASTIGKSVPISKNEFKTECFKVYRNGKSQPTTLVYGASEVQEIIKKRHSVNKTIMDIKKESDRVHNALKEINSLLVTHSIGNEIEMKSNLTKTTNIVVGKRRNNITMDQKLLLYNIDSLYLHMSKSVLSRLVMAHTYKSRAVIEMLKQDLSVLVKVLELEKNK